MTDAPDDPNELLKIFNRGADAATAAAAGISDGLERLTGFQAAIFVGMPPCPVGTYMPTWRRDLEKRKATKPDRSEAGCLLWEKEAGELLAAQEAAAKARGERPEPVAIEPRVEAVSRFTMRVIDLTPSPDRGVHLEPMKWTPPGARIVKC